jgi:hypothetical protein
MDQKKRERAWLGSDDEIWELGFKLQFALDPISSLHLIQASLLITKLGSMNRKKRERAWSVGYQMIRSESLDPKLQFALDPI